MKCFLSKVLPGILLSLFASIASAFDSFAIDQIKVEGLQRINLGTVFNYLPVKVGDTMDRDMSVLSINKLYGTGFFNDIQLARDGNTLLITVEERPSIAKISISGNDEIQSEDLLDGLKSIGLAEGRILDRSLLDKIQLDLQRQYFSRGYYATHIEPSIEDAGKNRVDVHLEVKEGDIAKIKKIQILGNRKFDNDTLLEQFELGIPSAFSVFSTSDQYSRQKLSADIETLNAYYLDRGFVNFTVDSTQVSISDDRSSVYIVINVDEGEQYSVKEIKLAGDLVVSESELKQLITLNPGDIFSRRTTADINSAITERLGEEGYAFANVNLIPDLNHEEKSVTLTFFVDPGQRVYVRRINISGNDKTDDEVIRRELRQMEGGWLSSSKLNRSRVRIQRLSYIGDVNIQTPSVPGEPDLVDIDISVTERPSGTFMAGIGYSGGQGMMLNASISMDNFMGSGEKVSAEINTNDVSTIYSFSHTDPYYTIDGVSRGMTLYYRETDTAEASVAEYVADVLGGSITFGFPITEYDTVLLGVGYENMSIETTVFTPRSYQNFLDLNASEFDLYKLDLSWSHDTRNRTIFADQGVLQRISLETVMPGSEIHYYKIHSKTKWLHALTKGLSLSLEGSLSYGDSYKETTDLPFFEKYYAGGVRSVRGYRPNSLGPREANDTIGGNFRALGTAALIFPPPFAADSSTLRMSLFYDIGNVFADIDSFDSDQLRQSTGLGLIWLSPVGPLVFNIARALNDEPGDETESFQFSLGSSF